MPVQKPKNKPVSANLPIASGKPVMGVFLDLESPEDRVELFLGSVVKNSDYQVRNKFLDVLTALGFTDRKTFLLTSPSGLDADIVCNHPEVVSATVLPSNTARALFALTVTQSMCNRMSNLHGGCQALLFDMCTTAALAPIAKSGFWQFVGVSRTLNMTYLRPAPVGVEIEIEAKVVHAGKRFAAIKGVMRRRHNGAVISVCEHGKEH